MKKVIFLMLTAILSIASFAQSSINVTPATASTKTRVVPTVSGMNTAIGTAVTKSSTTDQAFFIQENTALAAKFNMRQDSLVLAFNQFKNEQLKTNATIPKPITVLPGRGISFTTNASQDSLIMTPQTYFDAASKTVKTNY
jgi:hypothetical protein